MQRQYSFSGSIYMAPVDFQGVVTGPLRRTGNMYPLNISVSSKIKKQTSKEHDRSGQTIGSLASIEEIIGECVLRQLTARSFAWAVAGAESPMVGAGGDVVDEEITALDADDYMSLAHKKVSVVVVKNAAGDVTYQEGVDYILNANLGIFTIIASGSIAKDDVLHVSYTFAAASGYQIKIATNPTIRVYMRGSLVDDYTGDEMELELFMVTISSKDGINLISEPDTEYEELGLDLSIETPTGKTYPGTINGVAL